MRILIILFALITISLSACKKYNNPDTPNISQLSISQNIVRSGNSEDTVFLSFRYKDGDGDLGHDNNSSEFDIFIKDSRETNFNGLKFPDIPDEYKGLKQGISGTAIVELQAALFFILRPDRPNGDTVVYEIYIKDIAGNESNHLVTDSIYITP